MFAPRPYALRPYNPITRYSIGRTIPEGKHLTTGCGYATLRYDRGKGGCVVVGLGAYTISNYAEYKTFRVAISITQGCTEGWALEQVEVYDKGPLPYPEFQSPSCIGRAIGVWYNGQYVLLDISGLCLKAYSAYLAEKEGVCR